MFLEQWVILTFKAMAGRIENCKPVIQETPKRAKVSVKPKRN